MFEKWVGDYVLVTFQYKMGEPCAAILVGVDNRGIYIQRIVEHEVNAAFVATKPIKENWEVHPEKLDGVEFISWRTISTVRPRNAERRKFML